MAESSGFWEALRRHREAAGLTQLELAVRAGCSLTTVAKLEQGGREPTWAMVIALAKALGVSTDSFIVAEPRAEPIRRRRGKSAKVRPPSAP